jgi:hypothetical protein
MVRQESKDALSLQSKTGKIRNGKQYRKSMDYASTLKYQQHCLFDPLQDQLATEDLLLATSSSAVVFASRSA